MINDQKLRASIQAYDNDASEWFKNSDTDPEGTALIYREDAFNG